MARVKLGDYYYYGQGTEVNYEAAASQYRIASDKQSSSQAMFNLAYMYQQGYGLEKVSPSLLIPYAKTFWFLGREWRFHRESFLGLLALLYK